jgi:double-stranded uracil-DNA glycosylase
MNGPDHAAKVCGVASDPEKTCFDPVVDAGTRVLVLGTLPGAMSLQSGKYYANPTNQFWRLTESVIQKAFLALAYPDRLDALLRAGVGLWDVVGSCQRSGSLDADIREHRANPLQTFVAGMPRLRALAFNGGTAHRIGRRQLGSDNLLPLLALPSSSAAYCAMSFEAKRSKWLSIRSMLGSIPTPCR